MVSCPGALILRVNMADYNKQTKAAFIGIPFANFLRVLNFAFFFLIWVLQPFQQYFTYMYIEPIVHQRQVKTREPGEKPPDQP